MNIGACGKLAAAASVRCVGHTPFSVLLFLLRARHCQLESFLRFDCIEPLWMFGNVRGGRAAALCCVCGPGCKGLTQWPDTLGLGPVPRHCERAGQTVDLLGVGGGGKLDELKFKNLERVAVCRGRGCVWAFPKVTDPQRQDCLSTGTSRRF